MQKINVNVQVQEVVIEDKYGQGKFMSNCTFNILSPNFGKPHVFILGAGASRAAFPCGDVNGQKLPLMKDLIEIVKLGPLLEEYKWNDGTTDFETFYSRLYESNKYDELIYCLEQSIFKYFALLKLPDKPTLYDYLLLSLRKKDLIATFNWDPLLWQAMCRIGKRFGKNLLPSVLFLHGNVMISYCDKHRPVSIGQRGQNCFKCGSLLKPSHLLYPITKNYRDGSMIEFIWNEMEGFLKNAFIITIFGYSAPHTDKEAFNLMKKAIENSDFSDISQFEIIDKKNKDELHNNWKSFICRNHYSLYKSFYESLAARHPRRSCEDFFEAIMQNNPQPKHPIPLEANWEQLEKWIEPYIEQEHRK